MTAPERMPDKLLIKLVDNPNSLCDGMYINAAGGNEYTRTDIHQAALDRIAELEGAGDDLAGRAEEVFKSEYHNTNHLEGAKAYYDRNMEALMRFRAVLAKGDG